MKKSLLVISLCLASLLNAGEFDTKVLVGASAAKMDGETYTQYNVGYTANTKLDSGLI